MFWKDKVVFLTGASSGIGAALATAMAEQGAILGLLARRAELVEKLADECDARGGKARFFQADVVDAHAVSDAAAKFRDEFGRIDILIANAGIGGNNAETRELQADAVKRVIDVNLIGAVNSVSAVLPDMLTSGSGQLVAISSLAGFRGLPKSAAYSASKAGMTAFFESVRIDVQRKGISVSIIQPGFIKTPLTAGRGSKMPFIMELNEAVPLLLNAIERKKKFCAFPWQLATIARVGKILPAWLYDRIALRARFRE